MQRIGGLRRKTRHLLSKNKRSKGKINITRYMEEYKTGDKVKLIYDPAVNKSFFKMRYYGKVGTVSSKRGSCYEVGVKSYNNKAKTIIVHPAHLVRL